MEVALTPRLSSYAWRPDRSNLGGGCSGRLLEMGFQLRANPSHMVPTPHPFLFAQEALSPEPPEQELELVARIHCFVHVAERVEVVIARHTHLAYPRSHCNAERYEGP